MKHLARTLALLLALTLLASCSPSDDPDTSYAVASTSPAPSHGSGSPASGDPDALASRQTELPSSEPARSADADSAPSPATPTAPPEGTASDEAGASTSAAPVPSPSSPHTTATADALGISHSNYPRLDGSTSTYGLVSSIYWEMFPLDSKLFDENYPADPSRTVPSYHRLIAGEVDMIFVPYASADVLDAAADAGVELEFYKVAAEALVFVTPEENPTENITREQVRSIYLDYGIRNWSELGGPDRELVPICRNADSGSQSQMDNLILEGEPMHPDIQNNYVELTMEGMLQLTASYHNGGIGGTPTNSYALGYTLYSYLLQETARTGIGDTLKILSYEGVAPSAENIALGSYPLADGYYAVLRRDLPADHTARTLLDWMLRDPIAVEQAGLIPCPVPADAN